MGDHLHKRRLDLRLDQKETAARLGVDPESLRNWEIGRTEPAIRFYPALLDFLGYSPLPEGQTRGQRILRMRVTRGWSRKALADIAGIDEATVGRLEEDRAGMANRTVHALQEALDAGL
jgi:transcriptional regulator with XRE-family HTH domain